MEARIVQLPTSEVRVDGERIVIERLVVRDPSLAAIVADREPEDRTAFVERALRIGLSALQDASLSIDVDLVRDEFEKLLRSSEQANAKAAEALDQVLRSNFADGDGRLPRTLEKFLGDRGALRTFVGELFDETKRDSAIGRMRTLLGTYFDGDASKLALLLDPTRQNSPMHQFRAEVASGFERLHERLTAIEAAAAARGTERAKSTAKGADFEDTIEAMLADLARGAGDLVDRTGGEIGEVLRSKKGDFVVTVDPTQTGGVDLRIVVEAKDRPMSGRAMRDELREAKENRAAAVGLVVFSPAHAPAGIAPFDVRAGDVYCVIDPAAPDPATLEAALRLARLLALAGLREIAAEIDVEAVRAAMAGVRAELEALKGIKAMLTSIANGATGVQVSLDRLREAIVARVTEAETQIREARGTAR
ncbi:MAG TPA: hypothetical protein VE640_00350 [Candidatus Bathyarchaeia archaeon]|jgi:hypothetical protein|nr:hypothetical protein [Candidatus Bathyarchaeia archaeon]